MTTALTIPPLEPTCTAQAPLAHAPEPATAPRAAPPPPAALAPGEPNPTLRLDPALGLVVLQYRDGPNGGSTSIPTQQQLEAYRTGAATLPPPPKLRQA